MTQLFLQRFFSTSEGGWGKCWSVYPTGIPGYSCKGNFNKGQLAYCFNGDPESIEKLKSNVKVNGFIQNPALDYYRDVRREKYLVFRKKIQIKKVCRESLANVVNLNKKVAIEGTFCWDEFELFLDQREYNSEFWDSFEDVGLEVDVDKSHKFRILNQRSRMRSKFSFLWRSKLKDP